MMEGHQVSGMKLAAEIPSSVKPLLEDLKMLQAQVDSLPGPRLHQDHDFEGDAESLDVMYGWLKETAWVPYWGQPKNGVPMLFLGGRDPWIETLELRLWDVLDKLAAEAGCRLCGRGAVSPVDDELTLIHIIYPEIAEANGWVFSRQGAVVQ
jgi:hypothetical protein